MFSLWHVTLGNWHDNKTGETSGKKLPNVAAHLVSLE